MWEGRTAGTRRGPSQRGSVGVILTRTGEEGKLERGGRLPGGREIWRRSTGRRRGDILGLWESCCGRLKVLQALDSAVGG